MYRDGLIAPMLMIVEQPYVDVCLFQSMYHVKG
jgi:hypothetical protein